MGLRDHDEGPVTACIGDDRKTNSCIAGRPLQDQTARLQLATLLGFEDHLPSGAVLDRLARIHELGLAENGAAGLFGSSLQLDQRRVADRFHHVIIDFHISENAGYCLLARTLMDLRRAHKPSASPTG